MWALIAIVRITLVIPVVVIGYCLSFFVRFMSPRIFSAIARTWYRTVLLIIGLRCRYQGESVDGAVLMVSNHISWADILVVGAKWPYVFLARHDLASWPIIGGLTRRVGTLFIERGRGAPLAQQQVATVLKEKRSVFIFPEGRTSLGLEVGKFHPRLFQAAIDGNVPLQSIGLFYSDQDKQRKEGSRITYALDINFALSVWRTLAGPPIYAGIKVFPAIQDIDDRQQLAKLAQQNAAEFVQSALVAEKVKISKNH